MIIVTIENMVTLCKTFWSDLDFIIKGVTFCYMDAITYIVPAFTSYNSKIAPLLVYYLLKYREIVLAENGLF